LMTVANQGIANRIGEFAGRHLVIMRQGRAGAKICVGWGVNLSLIVGGRCSV
jgi:hypothetical protein